MNRMIVIGGVVAVVLVGAVYWMAAPAPDKPTDPDVLSLNGIHTHAQMEIYVNGVQKGIPANIGISDSGAMAGMHTHDPDGTVHIELAGKVTRDDTTVGKFFDVWGKKFDAFGSKLRMNVNGTQNEDGAAYQMQDGDKIVLSYFP
ncbi:hypothetical protein [Brevirhabdus sp.]|uniref:hypothetical protein n=1 Tax=Brevirhabdus sp. TaxID=2004514 RepID=UPI00405853E5